MMKRFLIKFDDLNQDNVAKTVKRDEIADCRSSSASGSGNISGGIEHSAVW